MLKKQIVFSLASLSLLASLSYAYNISNIDNSRSINTVNNNMNITKIVNPFSNRNNYSNYRYNNGYNGYNNGYNGYKRNNVINIKALILQQCNKYNYSCDTSKLPNIFVNRNYLNSFTNFGDFISFLQKYNIYNIILNNDALSFYQNEPIKLNKNFTKNPQRILVVSKDMTAYDFFSLIAQHYGYSFYFKGSLSYSSSGKSSITPNNIGSEQSNFANSILNKKVFSGRFRANNKIGNASQLNLPNLSKQKIIGAYILNPANIPSTILHVCNILDVYCVINNKNVTISRYETYIVNDNTLMNINYKGNLSININPGYNGTTTTTQTQNSGSKSVVSYVKQSGILNQIKQMLSPEGKVVESSNGFLYITDRPYYVHKIKQFIKELQYKERPITVDVKVIRLDMNNDIETGINWSSIFKSILSGTHIAGSIGISSVSGNLNTQGLTAGGNIATTGTSPYLSLNANDWKLFFSALQQYGKAKIVDDWKVNIRPGNLITFRDVTNVPYVTPELNTNSVSTQTTYMPNFVNVGLKITASLIRGNGSTVKGDILAELSQLVTMQTFNLGSSGQAELPETSGTKVYVPFSANLGQSIILTGFYEQTRSNNKNGIPGIVKIPILGRLFGYNQDESNNAQFLIVFTPER